MSEKHEIVDQNIRLTALNPSASFIVEAPAGSGKTDLLVKRFLALLSQGFHPKKILAITFTRKSAYEMKERIMSSLKEIAHPSCYFSDHLQIMTIDAFCHSIVSKAPLESHILTANLLEDEQSLRQDFLNQLLKAIAEDEAGKADLIALFQYFDNQLPKVRDLLFDLLKNRQEWLPIVLHAGSILPTPSITSANVEIQAKCIEALNAEARARFQALKPTHYRDRLQNWVNGNLAKLPILLMTQKGEWRKAFTAKLGLDQSEKAAYLDVLYFLQNEAHDDWRDVLESLANLPNQETNPHSILPVLLRVLPLAAAYLHILLQQKQIVDFNDIALMAVNLLENESSGVAEEMHQAIHHILIDEFQDTSTLQFRLLTAITKNWDEGRTLFLVGDPKQSIYRFRNANVGLFLQARDQGVSGIRLISLQLLQNFRTDKRLMGFINQIGERIFPKHADPQLGKVPYQASIPFHELPGYQGVNPYFVEDEDAEAIYIANEIKRLRDEYSDPRIAILVRSRHHFKSIVPALQALQLPFVIKDDQSRMDSPILDDLMNLMNALQHRGDRLAWLSLARSPICGLLKPDLLALAEASEEQTIWQAMLSNTANARIHDLTTRLYPFMDGELRNEPLYIKIKTLAEPIWSDPILNDFLAFISTQKILPVRTDFKRLFKAFERSNDLSDTRGTLELLTIHQAKGLEFDYVFLPALHKRVIESDVPLLLSEVFYIKGEFQFLLAEHKGGRAEHSSAYSYLRWLESQKSEQESLRLLYVALTRAKKGLWLTGSPRMSSKSFLKALAPMLSLESQDNVKAEVPIDTDSTFELGLLIANSAAQRGPFEQAVTLVQTLNRHEMPKEGATLQIQKIRRVVLRKQPDDRNPPDCLHPIIQEAKPEDRGSIIDRALGELIHRYLEVHAKRGNTAFYADSACIKATLLQKGLSMAEAATCISDVLTMIKGLKTSKTLSWILAPHEHAASEWALSYLNDAGNVEKVVIDRTFVDQGTRFILDYKVSREGAIVYSGYRQQLLRYQKILKQWDQTLPIRLGLYFPVQDKLVWV